MKSESGGEIRSPKAETRKKAKPKSLGPGPGTKTSLVRGCNPCARLGLRVSIRTSFGLRPSDFGFGSGRSLPRPGGPPPRPPRESQQRLPRLPLDQTLNKTNAAGKDVSLFVDAGQADGLRPQVQYLRSCHADITAKHPDDNVPAKPANCVGCHMPAEPRGGRAKYATSIHGVSHPLGASGAANAGIATARTTFCRSRTRFAGVQNEPAVHLRQMPQQPGSDQGIPDQVSRGGGAIHGQHPRPRAAENGPDRRAVVRRLPRRA